MIRNMKSKKVDKYLNRVYMGDPKVKAYNRFMVHKAVEMAEQELLEWHDPKDIPNDGREVLVKGICGTGGGEFYAVAYKIDGVLKSRAEVIDKYDTIIGWREIHE